MQNRSGRIDHQHHLVRDPARVCNTVDDEAVSTRFGWWPQQTDILVTSRLGRVPL